VCGVHFRRNVILPGPQTLLFSLALAALLVALLGRIVTAVALAVYLLGGVIVASMIMKSHLGVPLTIADLQFFFSNPIDDLQLFRNYPTLGAEFVALLAGAAVVAFVGIRFERPRLPSARARLLALILGGAAGALPLTVPAATERPAALGPVGPGGLPDDWDAWTAFEDMRRIDKAGGGLALLDVFFANRGMGATLPARRANNRFTAAATAGQGAASSGTGTVASGTGDAPVGGSTMRPDVMMILEESTFDPRFIAQCTLPGCDSTMFASPAAARRSQQGPLLVHTAGGGTWLSEFSFVSGFDWRTFGRGGAYAPVSIAPRLRQSLPRYLKSLGYRTVVVSPTGADFLRARSAYGQYGFDEFYASQELGFSNDWLSVHDALVFDKALAVIEEKSDPRPVFLFVLTIRNHGPHGEHEANIPATMLAERQAYDSALADYLGRLHDSASGLAELQKRWFDSPRPRVLGWFGDHQPELTQWHLETPAKVAKDRLPPNVEPDQRRYVTWYQLAANYGAPVQQRDANALDIPFLGAELLRFAQLPLDAETRAALDIEQHCAGRLLGCADRDLVADFVSWRIHELGAVQP
jgi:hypothetical protein